jgi:hypothetical protein
VEKVILTFASFPHYDRYFANGGGKVQNLKDRPNVGWRMDRDPSYGRDLDQYRTLGSDCGRGSSECLLTPITRGGTGRRQSPISDEPPTVRRDLNDCPECFGRRLPSAATTPKRHTVMGRFAS